VHLKLKPESAHRRATCGAPAEKRKETRHGEDCADMGRSSAAKAKLREFKARAEKEGTQQITGNGKEAVVFVTTEDGREGQRGNLAHFLAVSPGRRAD
jgi:hypothetical protein